MKTTLKICFIVLLMVAIPASAQVIIKSTSAPYVDPTDGAKLYATLCASCHGDNLMGREAVQTSVPHNVNLRLVTSHDASQVRSQIAFGSDANYHSVDMPAWNKILRRMYHNDDAKVQLAVYNLTEYVTSK